MLKKSLNYVTIIFMLLLMVSCQETTQTTTTSTTTSETTTETTVVYQLPDLTGLSKSEIRDSLDGLGISYEIIYETNTEVDENIFIRYDGGYEIGETITVSEQITVVIATSKLILPDLAGLTQQEIITALFSVGINFTMEVVTDNTVPDQTFSSYGDGLEAGDLVPSTYTITVNIGFNSTRLPDLEGLIKEEIADVLNELYIQYTFEYVVNDNYAEDIFAGYVDVAAGDFYEEGTITINLYKNTFTSNETSLIISKYVDGGNGTSDQAIEIFNATAETINLSDYHLAIFTNGSYEVGHRIDFGDVDLAPGETFVVANIGANAYILMRADLMTEDLVFDGNDTIQLRYSNDTYIDTIYNLGDSAFIMDDEVFVRRAGVLTGNREYTYSEWAGFVPDYVEVLGTHPVSLPEELTFSIIPRDFDDPLGGMDLVVLSSFCDGDTAYFYPGYLNDERVRFLGVDTPETYPTTQPWGLEAKDYTNLLLDSAIQIYIQSDPSLGYVDTNGRHLGLVWVNLGEEGLTIEIKNSSDEVVRTEHLTGWVLVNYQLVLNGYSYNYYSSDSDLIYNNRYLFRWFQEAEKFAEENGLGLHE